MTANNIVNRATRKFLPLNLTINKRNINDFKLFIK